MKEIKVSKDICIGCGACIAIDNEHFDFDDDGKSDVISQENIESEELTNAIESCPVSAISIDSKCNCGDDCTCGCKDGKECTCDGTCTCGCDCEDECNCDENCECGCDCHKENND